METERRMSRGHVIVQRVRCGIVGLLVGKRRVAQLQQVVGEGVKVKIEPRGGERGSRRLKR